jgi:hypothetical protein
MGPFKQVTEVKREGSDGKTRMRYWMTLMKCGQRKH